MHERLKKKTMPEDKVKFCLTILKGGQVKLLNANQLMEQVRHNLTQVQSLHFM